VTGFTVKDGRIIYTAQTWTDKMTPYSAAFLYDAGTDETRTLVEDGTYRVEYADFYMDGFLIAASDMKKYGYSQLAALYTLEDKPGSRLRLLIDPDEPMGAAVGSDCRYGGGDGICVDGNDIYYTTIIRTESAIRRVLPDGTRKTVIGSVDSFDGIDVRNGWILMWGLGDEHLQELFEFYTGKGARLVQLTELNRDALAGIDVSVPDYFEADKEDGSVEGFVLKPLDFDPSRTYPAVLCIHGGPAGAYGNVFFHEMQLLCAKGYAVFYCNPTGGSGRGGEWGDLRGKYGFVDYDDLMLFTDTVLKACPFIDPKRVGVMGGSYGGFMTNWIIGHTDRFAAAVSQRSIANWFTKLLTTDIGYLFNADMQQSTPWDRPEKLWEHSPLRYADKAVTPTLFIHSDEDYRCWLSEGLQMFTALKVHGVDCRLALFHGENHELSRSGKPKHRERRLREITDWFDQYLKNTQK